MKKSRYDKINNTLINIILGLAILVAIDSILDFIPNRMVSLIIALGLIFLLLILRIVNLRRIKRLFKGQIS